MKHFDQQAFNTFVLNQDIVGFFPKKIQLVSGRTSSWYVNWRNCSYEVSLIDKLSDFLLSFVSDQKIQFDCFYGTPDGVTKLAVISQYKWAKMQQDYKTKSYILPMGRKTAKDHGDPKDRFFVGSPRGKVIVLEDVTNTGGSLLKSVIRLQDMGVEVMAAVALTNRNVLMDDGRHVRLPLKERGVPYLSMSDGITLLPLAYEKLQPGEKLKKDLLAEFEKYGESSLVI